MPEALTSLAAINKALALPTLNVVDFWAGWCGPCMRFAPTFDAMSRSPAYEGRVRFFKVEDVVLKAEGSDPFGIRSLPTFILFLNGKEVARVRSAPPLPAACAHLGAPSHNTLCTPPALAAVWRRRGGPARAH